MQGTVNLALYRVSSLHTETEVVGFYSPRDAWL